MLLFVFVFVIATTTMAKGDYWEKYERDLAVKRIEATRLVAENPFHFDMVFPANIWLKTTIDFLKSILPIVYPESFGIDTKIEWRDYTDCVLLGPSYVYDFDKFVPVPCLYKGTVLWIKIKRIIFGEDIFNTGPLLQKEI